MRSFVIVVVCLGACRGSLPLRLVETTAQAMGTDVRLAAWTADEKGARRAFSEALDTMHRLEVAMTTWPHPGWPPSEVMQLNQAAGRHPVLVGRDTRAVLTMAREFAERSHGLFDVTFAPLTELWKFDEDWLAAVPSAAAVAGALRRVGYRHLVVDVPRSTAFLQRQGMAVSLGGIAKGYIVDAAAETLRARGLRDFVVQAGGDLYVAGKKQQAPWRVGIRDPRDAAAPPFAVAHLTDHAFSTAGDYERSFLLQGKRYHHILDPTKGVPCDASRSVTVLAPSATLADVLDDIVFCLGPQRGMQLLDEFPGCGAVIVDRDNEVWIHPTLRGIVEVLHLPTPGP